jgi:hypothetical protein
MENNDEKTERINFVTVCETGDPAFIAFAKSLLESEGIIYYFKGEHLQELGGLGRAGTGFNQIFGPVEIQVDEKDAQRAAELMEQAQQSTFGSPGDTEDEKEKKTEEGKREYLNSIPTDDKGPLKGILKTVIIGILIAVSIYYVYTFIQEYRQNMSWSSETDSNKDGKPDVFYYYQKGLPERIDQDRNFDGLRDYCETDDNFDGIFEMKILFKNNVINRMEYDLRNDKNPLIVENYVNGVISDAEYYNELTDKVWKKAFYKNGIISEELIDQDGDGKYDLSMRYNKWGRLTETTHLNKAQ